MKERIMLEKIQDKLACHYSLTGNNDYDNGYNKAVKDLCKVFLNTIDEDKNNSQWYKEKVLNQIIKSY